MAIVPVLLCGVGCRNPAIVRENRHDNYQVEDYLWLLTAKSQVIEQGKLELPGWGMRFARWVYRISPRSSQSPDTVVSIASSSVMKGASNALISVDFWNVRRKALPLEADMHELNRLNGKPVLAFINVVDVDTKHYFNAVFESEPKLVAAVEDEISRQANIIGAFDQISFAQKDDTIYPKVKDLVDKLVNPTTQDDALRQLEALGTPAIPSIICLMNDRRPLGHRDIEFRNDFPGAFEGSRHYRGANILDALNCLLNQMTGYYFGMTTVYRDTETNDSEEIRTHVLNGWRIVYHRLAIEKKGLTDARF
jgi:hypothetical protein